MKIIINASNHRLIKKLFAKYNEFETEVNEILVLF